MGAFADRALERQDLKNNNRTRACYCFCLDTSLSMGLNGHLALVNKGVRHFIDSCKDNIYARGSVEVCIVTFGGKARVHQHFANVRDIQYHDFVPDGRTPMGKGVELAVREIKERQQEFADSGISSFKPWLIIMSDGRADDDISNAVELVQKELNARRLKVSCQDMGNKGGKNDLARFTPDGVVDSISELDFDSFFDYLSRSAMSMSASAPSDDDDIR